MIISKINSRKSSGWWKRGDENIAKVLLLTTELQEKYKTILHIKNSSGEKMIINLKGREYIVGVNVGGDMYLKKGGKRWCWDN